MKDKLSEILRAKAISIFKNLCVNFLKVLYPHIEKHIPKKEEYCPEVQEFYKFFEVLIEREHSEANKKKWKMIRDIVCFGFEYDRPWLLRVIDALEESDVGDLKLTTPEKYLEGLSYNFRGKKHDI